MIYVLALVFVLLAALLFAAFVSGRCVGYVQGIRYADATYRRRMKEVTDQ